MLFASCLLFGLLLIVSGIVLNHKKDGKDPAYKEIFIHDTLTRDLSTNELKQEWERLFSNQVTLNRIIPKDSEYKLFLNGGSGSYNVDNGILKALYYKEITGMKIINEIHYNSGKRFTWMANIFAGSLIFLICLKINDCRL